MKLAFLSIAVLFVSHFALANESNPNIRVCYQLAEKYGAEYYQLNVSTPDFEDQKPFCKFGHSTMGSPTLLAWVNYKRGTDALEAYKNANSVSNCDDVKAAGTWDGVNADTGDHSDICYFNDGSWVELSVLKKGPSDSENAVLNKLFGI